MQIQLSIAVATFKSACGYNAVEMQKNEKTVSNKIAV
jgi:hypothetical protein